MMFFFKIKKFLVSSLSTMCMIGLFLSPNNARAQYVEAPEFEEVKSAMSRLEHEGGQLNKEKWQKLFSEGEKIIAYENKWISGEMPIQKEIKLAIEKRNILTNPEEIKAHDNYIEYDLNVRIDKINAELTKKYSVFVNAVKEYEDISGCSFRKVKHKGRCHSISSVARFMVSEYSIHNPITENSDTLGKYLSYRLQLTHRNSNDFKKEIILVNKILEKSYDTYRDDVVEELLKHSGNKLLKTIVKYKEGKELLLKMIDDLDSGYTSEDESEQISRLRRIIW